jgi:DNA-directed RNA polymerase sigma subunit (sigma70/sigma32)
MKLKIVDLSETQLKDYLVASCRIKEIAPEKLELVLSKYEKAGGDEKDDIYRMIIESHLKMVIVIANRYRGAGISFAGLIRLGNSGLISAVKKWETGDAESFLQHLVWAVEGAILDALISVKKEAIRLGETPASADKGDD